MKKTSMVLMAVLAAGALSVRAQSAEAKPAEAKPAEAKPAETDSALVAARGQIDKVIETPAEMTKVMKGLSAADQKQFLADVNKAIADLPASAEERTAKFLNVNHAALKGAAKGNVAVLIAEVFATVSPEALTVISERFAADLLSRSADAKTTYTDAQFTQIALNVMEKVNERCAETDNAAPRSTFAILTLVRASEGSSEDLVDKLVDTLPTEEAKEMARSEWIPSALGADGREQSYESLLASADAGRRPDYGYVLVIAGPQNHDTVLHDLIGQSIDPSSTVEAGTPVLDAAINPLQHTTPIVGGDLSEKTEEAVAQEGGGDVEPTPYNGQTLH